MDKLFALNFEAVGRASISMSAALCRIVITTTKSFALCFHLALSNSYKCSETRAYSGVRSITEVAHYEGTGRNITL
jgi:hypothetical protein